MRIFITGGTGFIGQALCHRLQQQGHHLTVLTRQAKSNTQTVTFVQDFTHLEGFDAVINLAGEPIFAKRWTDRQKQTLLNSRIFLTDKISQLIRQSDNPPHCFISGSATGFYGDVSVAKKADELTACGNGFSAQLCTAWEQAAFHAQTAQTRVCVIRTGIVLDKQGGALKQMLPLYRLGLGGKLGSGRQYWAWIALADQLRAIDFLLQTTHCQGAFNLVAPQPVAQAHFNQQLAKSVNRPACCHVPTFLFKGLLGERAQLLLDHQPILPTALLAQGFAFQHPHLDAFLATHLAHFSIHNSCG